MKFVVLALVVGLVLWLMFGRRSARGPQAGPPVPPSPPPARAALEGMVRCAHCGVHLPAGDSIAGPGGRPYCSAAHRDLGPRVD